MHALLLIGTTRSKRNTVRAAKHIEKVIGEKEGISSETADLNNLDIPSFNQRRTESGHPNESVEKLGKSIEESDFLIIISPEYNHSFPGVLKNALDHYYEEYRGKKIAYVTTSSGGFGGIRQLSHLHDFTIAVNATPGPNLPISNIKDKLDEEGHAKTPQLRDKTINFIQKIKYKQEDNS